MTANQIQMEECNCVVLWESQGDARKSRAIKCDLRVQNCVVRRGRSYRLRSLWCNRSYTRVHCFERAVTLTRCCAYVACVWYTITGSPVCTKQLHVLSFGIVCETELSNRSRQMYWRSDSQCECSTHVRTWYITPISRLYTVPAGASCAVLSVG